MIKLESSKIFLNVQKRATKKRVKKHFYFTLESLKDSPLD